MSRNLQSELAGAANDARGFTLMEVVTVCSVIGIVGLLALPSMARFSDKEPARTAAMQMAGLFKEAHSSALAEGTPQLLYINPVTPDGAGNCVPVAQIVHDTDRSYTLSAGDTVRDVELEGGACGKVEFFGEGDSPLDAELPMPYADQSVRGLELDDLIDPNEPVGKGKGAKGKGKGPKKKIKGGGPRTERVAAAIIDGATFPLDIDSGRPVVAFSERGIPVDTEDPTSWGSGAGAVYLTDKHSTVYAAVVEPLGSVQLRVFDPATGDWR